ncbi:unnamed protein product [Spirodela intermedia]|uniref:PHD-type domain-containing protein n=1 Tax=Spirodela intermedia TaxID=51605 RepID=A0A7I8ISB6_SPIIN|nr:unnamed protein product [Spirodela intermedia]CAA6660418.1 unnamed protein product [Spirodela intermedia]
MSDEERDGDHGSSGRMTSFTLSDGIITYKRRKRSSAEFLSDRDPSVSSGDQKAEEQRGSTTCNGIHEIGALSRIQYHWKTILEQMLSSQDVNDDVVASCIQKALLTGNASFMNKTANCTQAELIHMGNGNFCDEAKRESLQISTLKRKEATSNELHRDNSDQMEDRAVSKSCQNFALLCDLLLGKLPGIKADSILDFNVISSRMKSRAYGLSVGLLHQDLQRTFPMSVSNIPYFILQALYCIHKIIRKIGQELSLLSTSLSNITQASCQKQKLRGLGTEEKNSMDSHTTTQFPCESDRSTKLEQTEASCPYKVSNCKECGTEADGKCSLVCDGCLAVYHFSCLKPAVQEIPVRNWYCPGCTKNERVLSAELTMTHTHEGRPHQDCVVCGKLKASGMLAEPTEDDEGDATHNDSRESSISSMDSDGSPEPARTARERLCKLCGKCEEDDKRFIVCDHSLCIYKYYHIRCLKSHQVAYQHHKHGGWYCPSCLCRGCLTDKDDDLIVMCDGCDEGYHIYCMQPPLTSVPKGKWFCVPCNYEQWVLQQHAQSDENLSNGSNRPMDLLLSAAEKVEKLAAGREGR